MDFDTSETSSLHSTATDASSAPSLRAPRRPQPRPPAESMLLINPNTTKEMTDALRPLVASLGIEKVKFRYYTAPLGVPSVNNDGDACKSATACMPSLRPLINDYDRFIVCCYSRHPLTKTLREAVEQHKTSAGQFSFTSVVGIFECSVREALGLKTAGPSAGRDVPAKFGIVSTGKQWEKILSEAVYDYIGEDLADARYVGTETTGYNADELHSAPAAEINARIGKATKRLLSKGARTICLGCAGMAGMDSVVRAACIEQLGEEEGSLVHIIDGVVSAIQASL